MAISQVELCNLALSRAGGQRISQITSLGEASNEARQCAVKLPHLIRTALRAFPWRFATRKVALAQTIMPSTRKMGQDEYQQHHLLYGTAYIYQYPEDCVAARAIYSVKNGVETLNSSEGEVFHTELGEDGTRLIITHVNDAVLLYTSNVFDPTVWDPLFYDALSWQLAAELCVSLGNDISKGKSLDSKASLAWDKAKSADAGENYFPPFASSYLLARA